jgi:hypothetical protein
MAVPLDNRHQEWNAALLYGNTVTWGVESHGCLWAPSLSAEQWTESGCKEVSGIQTFAPC